WVALMVLTTIEDEQAVEQAKYLLARNQQSEAQPANRAIMELITTIMVYKFEDKSQREVEQMLGITLQETRVYREIKEEGIKEGLQREKYLVLRQLTRRVGELPQQVRQQVESLPVEQLENLGEALLDFSSMADLYTWLEGLKA
nr:Rpn family recombination-promoting nuclease/putative transposase [Calothrix sp. MO_167.B12]